MRLFLVCFVMLLNLIFIERLSAAQNAIAAEESASHEVLDISVQRINGRIAAAITLSIAANTKVNLDQWLHIESRTGDVLTGAWTLGPKAKTLYFTNVEPEKSYKVTVREGLPLANWKLLKSGVTQLIETPAITPMLGFSGNGNLLAKSLTEGLPVVAVNVPTVDVDFYRIPEKQLVSFLSDNSRRGQLDFWQVENYLKKVQLVYSGRFDLKLLPNQTATSYLPIKKIEAFKQQGIYLAVMRRSGEYSYNYPATWFAISDLGVHLRVYKDSVTASVVSLATAKPLDNVKLSLLDSSGNTVAQKYTDEFGLAEFQTDAAESAELVVATSGNETSVVRLFGPVLDLSEFPIMGGRSAAQQLFFYSPRDLYRPGEAATVSALLRSDDGELTPKQVITFKLKQPDGKTASEQRIAPNDLGYFQSEWQLPKDAATGEWSVSAKLGDGSYFEYLLQVEDFLPERMDLTLTSDDYQDSDKDFRIALSGEYLYGAPANGNRVQLELISQSAPHPFKQYEDFYFNNPQQTEFNQRIELDDRLLDKKGMLDLTIENAWRKAHTPMQLKLYASLLDSGGRPVSRSISSFALPAKQLVGIRPLFEDDIAPYDGLAQFEILVSDGKKRLAAKNLTMQLIREQRNYHWVYTDSEGWTSDYTERHYPVTTQDIAVKEGQLATVSLPVDWGHYRLEITDRNTNIITGYKFRAGWSADETALAGRPDRIGLAVNKQRYSPGDQVTVEIKPPAAGSGYLLVESDKVLYRQPIQISKEGGEVSFILDPEWKTHNMYISVLLVQPGDNRDEKLPRRMMGIQHLPLQRDSRELKVEIDAPDKIEPNTQITVPIKVLSSENIGPIQLTLAAVDVGVLNISKFTSPDPFDSIFQQRAYTVTARDSYTDLIKGESGVTAELKFGGDEDSVQGGEADPEVEIVSWFSGVVDVDAAGSAQIPLQIPDFNGRLRLMAVAFSEQSFGAQEAELEVAAPVIAELTKPRFLRGGDSSYVVLDLQNASGEKQTLTLRMKLAEGLNFKGVDSTNDTALTSLFEKQIILADGEKQTLKLPVQAGFDYTDVVIDLQLSSTTGEDKVIDLQRQWLMSVYPAWSKTDLKWQQVLSKGESFDLRNHVLPKMLAGRSNGELTVSSQPPLDIAAHLTALKAYPYGCLEQTTSGVFPQLYINDSLLAELGIKGSSSTDRHKAIKLAIQRLQTMQRGSGGFGLWSDQSPEEHWLSVYVFDFLMRAQELGYQVPQANLQKTKKRIVSYLRNPNKIRSYYQDINQRDKFSIRAYAGLVLAKWNSAPLSVLRNMYDTKRDVATPMAMIQLGIALKMTGDQQRGSDAIERAIENIAGFSMGYYSYGSAVRDLALSSFWLLEEDFTKRYWQPLLLELQVKLQQRHWLSTQERNALFLLGRILQTKSAEKLDINVNVASQSMRHQLARFNLPLNDAALQTALQVENLADAEAYMNLRVSGYEVEAPIVTDKGLYVERRYYSIAGDETQIATVRSGEKFIVELTIQSAQRLRQGLVVDLLPAGFEIENQNLADSYSQDQLSVKGEPIAEIMSELDIKHQEYRKDRFVMAIDLRARQETKVYYLVRAVSAGQFIVPPTFAEDMYRPELRYQGESSGHVTVLPRQ